MAKPEVLFVLTVDTEEEWLWESDFPSTDCSVRNVKQLPAFQQVCNNEGIRPTYFVDYAVAQNLEAQDILKQVLSSHSAEIGAHLHPWCNPPFFGKTGEAESHVINLPISQVAQKLDALNHILNTQLGVTPRSFRSGRWGINGPVLQLLAERGYKVDSSVYPFYKNDYFSCEGSPLIPYWPDWQDVLSTGEQRQIMQIPVSAGFNRKNFTAAAKWHNRLSQPPFSWLRAVGVMWHTHLLRKLYLSPELTSTMDMNSLIDQCLANEHPVIHMYLHSSSLVDGVTGLLNAEGAFELITAGMVTSLRYLKSRANVTCCTISEAAIRLAERGAYAR